jgi:hypothetical protein
MTPPAMRHASRAALLLAVAASPLAAQARVTLTPFASSNRSLPDEPNIYGLAITSWAGIMGIRASGALGDLRTEKFADGTSRTRPGAWTADADLVLAPAQSKLWRAALPGFEPAGFVGIGTEGDRNEHGDRRSAPTWSWGGSLAVPIAGPLAIESEARWRRPFEHYERPVPEGYSENWEFRVGLAFRFGSSRGRGRGHDDWPSSGSRVRIPGSTGSRAGSGGRIALPVPGSGTRVPASRVLNTADDYLGTPYVYGGTSPDGFDCSGFVQYVYRRHGVTLPRTSREQAVAGSRLSASVAALQPGDLMFFSSRGGRIDHVAIYAGERRIIHSTSSGGGVRFDDLHSSRGRWFVEHMVAARRVNDGGGRVFDASELVKALAELDAGDLAPKP